MYKKVRRLIAAVSKKADALVGWLLLLLFGVLLVLVTINAVLRYVFQKPLFVVTELANGILVYLIFLGAAMALYHKEHVQLQVDFFWMPAGCRRFFKMLCIILNSVFIVCLIIYGIRLAVMNCGSFTGVLAVPMGLVYAVIPVSGLLMALQYADLVLEEKERGSV